MLPGIVMAVFSRWIHGKLDVWRLVTTARIQAVISDPKKRV
jgi:hypothetical protein